MATVDSPRMPQLIAFDLDYTLWHLWIDAHATPPFKRAGDNLNQISDANDTQISFYSNVPEILSSLRTASALKLAVCSRTHAPAAAREALDLLLIKDANDTARPARGFFDYEEIYPGSKMKHFKELHEKTGIPYEEMVFYDDEYRNSEVSKLGVMFVLVDRGLDHKVFDKGLEKWRRARDAASE